MHKKYIQLLLTHRYMRKIDKDGRGIKRNHTKQHMNPKLCNVALLSMIISSQKKRKRERETCDDDNDDRIIREQQQCRCRRHYCHQRLLTRGLLLYYLVLAKKGAGQKQNDDVDKWIGKDELVFPIFVCVFVWELCSFCASTSVLYTWKA